MICLPSPQRRVRKTSTSPAKWSSVNIDEVSKKYHKITETDAVTIHNRVEHHKITETDAVTIHDKVEHHEINKRDAVNIHDGVERCRIIRAEADAAGKSPVDDRQNVRAPSPPFLMLLYFLYLVFGAAVFQYFELEGELRRMNETKAQVAEDKEIEDRFRVR